MLLPPPLTPLRFAGRQMTELIDGVAEETETTAIDAPDTGGEGSLAIPPLPLPDEVTG